MFKTSANVVRAASMYESVPTLRDLQAGAPHQRRVHPPPSPVIKTSLGEFLISLKDLSDKALVRSAALAVNHMMPPSGLIHVLSSFVHSWTDQKFPSHKCWPNEIHPRSGNGMSPSTNNFASVPAN